VSRIAADASPFAAIADPTRRAILDTLRDGERSVNEIREALGRIARRLSQPAFSQHLAVLRRSGLVKARRAGRHQFYTFHPQPLTEVVDWIAAYDKFWTAKLDNLGRYLDQKHGTRPTLSATEEHP
jgi:DNA-binding transcriptional ArsR family regulator